LTRWSLNKTTKLKEVYEGRVEGKTNKVKVD
jgi:hypothetical protein